MPAVGTAARKRRVMPSTHAAAPAPPPPPAPLRHTTAPPTARSGPPSCPAAPHPIRASPRNFLIRTSVKAVVMWSSKSPTVACMSGQQIAEARPVHEPPERLPGHIVHPAAPPAPRNTSARPAASPHTVRTRNPASKNAMRHPAPRVRIHIRPHMRPARQEPARLAVHERRVGEQRRRHRLQRQRHPQLAHHVLLAGSSRGSPAPCRSASSCQAPCEPTCGM